MSRRKAGSTPRRVDPAPAASSDDEMETSELEMSELVIDVKTEPETRPLQPEALERFLLKEMSTPEHLGAEPRHSPRGPVDATAALQDLRAQDPWAMWSPLTVSLPGEYSTAPHLGAPPSHCPNGTPSSPYCPS